ncbi:MAG: tetratricopeptide repeat protein, partial [Dehalococcoidia bacterium]
IKVFEQLKNLGTKTKFLVEAYYSLVTLSLDKGDASAAKGYLLELKKLIRSGSGGIGAAQIALLEGLIEEALKRYPRAIDQFNKASAQGDGEVGSQAQMGIARCKIAMKKPADAAKGILRFVKRPRTSKQYAEAYLLMGHALKAQARAPDDWEKALMAYVRVHLRYPGDEKTESRALYEAAGCYRRIGGDKGVKRSAQLLAMLKRKYPNSPFLKEGR